MKCCLSYGRGVGAGRSRMGAEHRHRRALVLRPEDTAHGGPVVAATAAFSCWIFGSPNRYRLLHDLYWGSCVGPPKALGFG
jgi:hypothetical protein